jgi:formylmethanofuran dehydrogenase subunit C
MSKHWSLRLKTAPALRLDLRALQPTALAALSHDEAAQLPVFHGNERTTAGDWFDLSFTDAETPALTLQGDLSRADRIGWCLAGGAVHVEGDAGDYLGAGLQQGLVHTRGNAGVLAGCEMRGGRLEVDGNVGDFAGAPLPGSMEGMRGGVFIVRGHAGERLADRMRRGSLIVCGDAGDFAASRLVAGTVAIGGRIGAHLAHGMRRGSVVCFGTPALAPTFNPMQGDHRVIWQLLSRDLARLAGPQCPFARLQARQRRRWACEVGAGGQCELWCLA